MSKKLGWVHIDGEKLSTFHKQLLAEFPHYRSVAVSECSLPGSAEVLPYEERLRMNKLASDAIVEAIEPGSPAGNTQRVVDSCGKTLGTIVESRDELAKAFEKTVIEPPTTPSLLEEWAKDRAEVRAAIRKSLATISPNWKSLLTPKIRRKLYFTHAGKAGETVAVSACPKRLFRGDRVNVTDSYYGGEGTYIESLFVGARRQISFVFADKQSTNAVSKRLEEVFKSTKIDTCEPPLGIAFIVRFEKGCTFSAIIEGETLEAEDACPSCINSNCECYFMDNTTKGS